MAAHNVLDATAENWRSEVLDSELPVLIDFWAEWCGPCRLIGPMIGELADELAGRLKVVKVNIDDEQQLAAEFGIRSIPTLLIIKGGAVQEQMVGARSKADLMAKLKPHLPD